MRVLTRAHLTSYKVWTASLIWVLEARTSQTKTRVLISSIFLMADSVVTGHLRMRYLSILFIWKTDFLGAFGVLFLVRVLGRKKCTLVRALRCLTASLPLLFWAAFLACWTFLSTAILKD